MKLQLMEPVDRMQQMCPTVTLAIVVDDLVMQRHGGEKRVGRDIILAAQVLVNGLGKDSISISVKKSQVLASTPALEKEPKVKLHSVTGAQAAKHARNLGTDFVQ
eukprot:7221672-Pyramimonas_sp.AAC.1